MSTSSKKIAPEKCSLCGEQGLEEFRPFCSKRCADIDLGRWLTGKYTISGSDDAEEDGLVAPQDLVFHDPDEEEPIRH